MAHFTQITTTNHTQEVLQASQLVLLEFTAAWCAPCQKQLPILAEIAVSYASQLKVCQVDIDSEPDLAARYRVLSIPTILLLQNGQVRQRVQGFKPKAALLKAIGLG